MTSKTNLAGHKLPTAYPSRRAWIHLSVRDAGGALLFESGAMRPDGSIVGNDNRLLPEGFDQETADAAFMVHGKAREDADFRAGSDRIRYRVETPPGVQRVDVRARLMFQTIGYRWAQNLAPYEAYETRRFVTYYNENAETSANVLAEAVRRQDLP